MIAQRIAGWFIVQVVCIVCWLEEHYMNTQVQKVLERLLHIATIGNFTDRDRDIVTSIIASNLEAGWTEDEIFQYLKHCEEINSSIDEDFAIKRMQEITVKVKQRLGT